MRQHGDLCDQSDDAICRKNRDLHQQCALNDLLAEQSEEHSAAAELKSIFPAPGLRAVFLRLRSAAQLEAWTKLARC